jgi:hypothetical protein
MRHHRVLALALLVAVPAALSAPAGADHKPGHKPPGNAGPLSLTAKPATVLYGGATVLSGRLTGSNSSGRSVALREDRFPFGDGFKPVANVTNATTNAQGRYSFTVKPGVNTIYRTSVGSQDSPNTLVNVRIRMSLRVSDSTPSVGQRVRFRGRACPAHNGLTVAIQRRSSSGRYRTVRRTTLKAAPTCSSYSRTFRIYRDGRYRATADDRDHARGYSRSRFLDAHR